MTLVPWQAAESRDETTKPHPKATYHLGTCLHCGGEGDVLTIAADPLDLSLCGDCLAFLIGDAAGIP